MKKSIHILKTLPVLILIALTSSLHYSVTYAESYDNNYFYDFTNPPSDWTLTNKGQTEFSWNDLDLSNPVTPDTGSIKIVSYTSNMLTDNQGYAITPVNYSGGSFTLSYDFSVFDRDTGDINIGLFDTSLISNTTGLPLNVDRKYIKTMWGGYEQGIDLRGQNSNGNFGGETRPNLFTPGPWYHSTIKYDASQNKIDLIVRNISSAGELVLHQTESNLGSFSNNMNNLGISMKGGWSEENRMAKGYLDDVYFADNQSNKASGDGVVNKWVAYYEGADKAGSGVDVARIKQALSVQYNLPDSPVIYYEKSDPVGSTSIDNIKHRIEWLYQNADGDDIAIFYYTGHGVPGAISPTQNGTNNIPINQLSSWLDSVKAANTIAIIDSCYSGFMAADAAKPTKWILSSASPNETSTYTTLTEIGIGGGFFTRGLQLALLNKNNMVDKNTDGEISLTEAFDYAYDYSSSPLRGPLRIRHPVIGMGGDDLIISPQKGAIPYSELILVGNSPIDIILTDSTGKQIGKTVNNFGEYAYYIEGDILGNGHVIDELALISILKGDYSIKVIPEADAKPFDTFTLKAYLNSNVYQSWEKTFAQDALIKDIPIEGYNFKVIMTPEPYSALLFGIGLPILAGFRARKRYK